MKKLLLALVLVAALCQIAPGQVTLYQELFPHPTGAGDQLINSTGWRNDIPERPNRLFVRLGLDGGIFAYEDGAPVAFPLTTAFYTSATLDTGSSGMAFPTISTLLPTGVTLSVDIRPGFSADNIAARVALQINGTDWYAAATAFPVPGVESAIYTTYSLAFSPAAAGWNTLTVSGDGSGTSATIGGAAAGDLTGNITGAGLILTHSINDGDFDFDNFLISTVPEPSACMLLGLGALVLIRRAIRR